MYFLKSVDTDCNGTIEFEEFLILMQNRLQETNFEVTLFLAMEAEAT
jgi:Ca2+-binding EF-hand superfamily protein